MRCPCLRPTRQVGCPLQCRGRVSAVPAWRGCTAAVRAAATRAEGVLGLDRSCSVGRCNGKPMPLPTYFEQVREM
jgi:hypothetical protein